MAVVQALLWRGDNVIERGQGVTIGPSRWETATEPGVSFPAASIQLFTKLAFYTAVMRTLFLPCQLSDEIQSQDQRSHKRTLLLRQPLARSWLWGRSFASGTHCWMRPLNPVTTAFPQDLPTLAWRSIYEGALLRKFLEN